MPQATVMLPRPGDAKQMVGVQGLPCEDKEHTHENKQHTRIMSSYVIQTHE